MNKYKNKFSLDGKTAFVLGGSGKIGSEILNALIDFDAKVISLDIAKPNSEKAIFKNFDVTNLDKIEDSVDSLIDEFSCPHIFINCSYPRTSDWPSNSFEQISLESFRKNIDLHLNSYAWLAKIFANKMKQSKTKGSIIQLGSIYGAVGQDLNIYKNTEMKENMTYSIIKGGIHNLTRQMSSYYGKYAIRINTICSGGIIDKDNQDKQFIQNYSNHVPLRRMGDASEIASTVVFLAADASSYITGSTLVVDGGWTAI